MYDIGIFSRVLDNTFFGQAKATPAGEKITIPPNVPGASVPTFRISEENESFVHSVSVRFMNQFLVV